MSEITFSKELANDLLTDELVIRHQGIKVTIPGNMRNQDILQAMGNINQALQYHMDNLGGMLVENWKDGESDE